MGDVCCRRRLYGHDDWLGMRSLGNRVVLPALLLVWRLLSDLLPVLANLWIRFLVQPLHGSLWNCGTNLWTVWGCGIRRKIQPEHRHICARRLRLWTLRGARRGPGL